MNISRNTLVQVTGNIFVESQIRIGFNHTNVVTHYVSVLLEDEVVRFSMASVKVDDYKLKTQNLETWKQQAAARFVPGTHHPLSTFSRVPILKNKIIARTHGGGFSTIGRSIDGLEVYSGDHYYASFADGLSDEGVSAIKDVLPTYIDAGVCAAIKALKDTGIFEAVYFDEFNIGLGSSTHSHHLEIAL